MVSEGDVLFFDNGQLIPTLIELIPEVYTLLVFVIRTAFSWH